MLIPEHKIEEIRGATDIVEVVSDYVQLKKRGSAFIGLCPFHGEKTPSFNVNPSMGIFKCFGCGEGGNVFNFVMKMENLGFGEVARMLADRAGIVLEVREMHSESSGEIESIYHALRFAARFFYDQMIKTDAGRKHALEYFHARGYADETIRLFGLGYAPDRWEGLLANAGENHIKAELLEKAGLVLSRDGGGFYDRFRHRAMFPIFSHIGKVIGFGGRILEESDNQPKYINSPETRVYHKSEVLYGLFQAKQEIRGKGEAVLVEGYTDVISLFQAGIRNVVASSGTALTPAQIRILGRYSRTILLLYDADSAGGAAAIRGIDLILEQGFSPYLVSLPEGEDPDSFVREHGGEAFRKYLARHRKNFVQFKFELARRDKALETPEGATSVMQSIIASIAGIPDPLAREAYLRQASDVLGVPEATLHAGLQRIIKKGAKRIPVKPPPSADQRPRPDIVHGVTDPGVSEQVKAPLPEKMLLRVMLEHGSRMVAFVLSHMSLQEFTEGAPRQMVERLLEMYEEESFSRQPFLDGTFGPAVQALAAEVLMDRHNLSENWEVMRNITVPRFNEDVHQSAISAMTFLKLDRVNKAIAEKKTQVFRAQHDGLEPDQLLKEMQELHRLKRSIMTREFLNLKEE